MTQAPSAREEWRTPGDELWSVLSRHWGFDQLRPLQREAIESVLADRDSIVVMPTGGGKSLCYQAPAVLRDKPTIVISPLLSLMKDQVDGLEACGIDAVEISSARSPGERREAVRRIRAGETPLVFVSPERLLLPHFLDLLREVGIRTFAIDEAHCISHWGHDFRPEYRQLSRLRDLFPDASIHAYTATATERVRRDIASSLSLRDPVMLVGDFDRPNLHYRIVQRVDELSQVVGFLEEHRGEAGIIYCLRRRDVDDLHQSLSAAGWNVLPYHAGLPADQRKKAQEEFLGERCDLIVATVAFGMGIDRSNIRFVLHTSMPKSVEHYQQETGRAGRDGLDAECVLFYSPSDRFAWRSIFDSSDGLDPDVREAMDQQLDAIDRYAGGGVCRHRALVEHFGQEYGKPSCEACDLCLGDTKKLDNSLMFAQKILSCVARTGERFGAGHVVDVLRGASTKRIRELGHDQLSTYGLLPGTDPSRLRNWILQLVSKGALSQEEGRYPILKLTGLSWQIMRGEEAVVLYESAAEPDAAKSSSREISWDGVDRELFDVLKDARRSWASEREVPAYVIFGDATLREIARVRPSDLQNLRRIRGVGEQKLALWGESVLEIIATEAQRRNLQLDAPPLRSEALSRGSSRVRWRESRSPRRESKRRNETKHEALRLFAEGKSIEYVMKATDRKRPTVAGYLAEFIRNERPESIEQWIDTDRFAEICNVIDEIGGDRLRPYFDALGGTVDYDQLRLIKAWLDVSP